MNEEQADKLINILNKISENLDLALRENPKLNLKNFENLKRFKEYIIANGFYCSLTEEQKRYIRDVVNNNTPTPIKVES